MIARTRPATRLTLAALLVATVAAGAACGSDDDSSSSTTPVADTVPAGTAPSGIEPTGTVIEVDAVDYAFENLPDTVSAGTRLTLVNNANAELHELVAIRLADDELRSVDELVHLPEAELGAILGAAPPAAVLLAAPGAEQVAAVGDGTLTQPGRYLVFCSIPSGVAPDVYLDAAAASNGAPPQVDGGPPHFVHGMFAELTVE
ncbi:MAG: hypothetical protein ABWZ99_09840 [Ilumatobacteraceae bacterium]